MKRISMFAAAALAAVAVVPATSAGPRTGEPPFPGVRSGGVFVAAQTVRTSDGAMTNYFAPGGTVAFRAYAVDKKTHKLLTKKRVKFFYAKIPNQKNVKLKYTPKSKLTSGRFAWTGRWKIPANYPEGVVAFKIFVKTKAKRVGVFKQAPVAAAQLTVLAEPPLPPGTAPNARPAPGASRVDVALYADTVNGSRPAGTEPRPRSCTQTNVFRRGEQLVVRSWGFDMATGDVLSIDNVSDAHFSAPGVPNIALNWGLHGPTGAKVYFWANQWQIPTDYPLGEVSLKIQFTTVSGKVGKLTYPITINP